MTVGSCKYRFCCVLMSLLCTALATAAEAPTEAERAVLDQRLVANTRDLHVAFAARDTESERRLYEERMRILLALRALRPRSKEPPIMYEGLVEHVSPRDIHLRTTEKTGLSLGIGRISDPGIQQEYAAIDIGDRVRLVYTHEPDLLRDDAYGYELTKISRIGRPIRRVALMQQDVENNELFEMSYALLHYHPDDTFVSVLVTLKNKIKNVIGFHGDPHFTLRVTEGDRQLDPHIVHGTASIGPGDIGILLVQVRRADLQGRFFRIGLTHRTASFSAGSFITLPKEAE